MAEFVTQHSHELAGNSFTFTGGTALEIRDSTGEVFAFHDLTSGPVALRVENRGGVDFLDIGISTVIPYFVNEIPIGGAGEEFFQVQDGMGIGIDNLRDMQRLYQYNYDLRQKPITLQIEAGADGDHLVISVNGNDPGIPGTLKWYTAEIKYLQEA